ncbi:hypothetical protein [Fluviispira sanaruensis]|uniref:hypothetical protein n=1 Tax=Fluviispira sanaruensis TaxID=2493639 RepID=UPI001559493E|nr:hypothetical protein [Fluviispira sanaruensis]
MIIVSCFFAGYPSPSDTLNKCLAPPNSISKALSDALNDKALIGFKNGLGSTRT